MSDKPKLRMPIEIKFDAIGDKDVLVLRCPLGITPQPLLLLPAAAPILTCFDGKTSVAAIAAKFSEYGLTPQIVIELVQILDAGLFLDNARFHEAERRFREDFKMQPVRRAALAGAGYPATRDELAHEIDGYLNCRKNGAAPGGRLACLVAPHIDYRRGGRCYGISYRRLGGQRHDLYVVIGVAHMYSPYMFHLSAKDFAGPLGTHPVAREFVARLAKRYGAERSFADEVLHRNEHSIELQMPFLGRVQPGASIVPILTGSFHSIIEDRSSPADCPEYDEFAAGLAECLREEAAAGENVCLIAAVDMAHVGRTFGDAADLSPDWMKRIAERDRLYLDAVLAQDRDRLFAHVAEDKDARRICGFPALYLALDVLTRTGPRCKGELLDYQQAVDYQSQCAVTFAGAALYR